MPKSKEELALERHLIKEEKQEKQQQKSKEQEFNEKYEYWKRQKLLTDHREN